MDDMDHPFTVQGTVANRIFAGNKDPWGNKMQRYFVRRKELARCTDSAHEFFRLRTAGIRSWKGEMHW